MQPGDVPLVWFQVTGCRGSVLFVVGERSFRGQLVMQLSGAVRPTQPIFLRLPTYSLAGGGRANAQPV